MGFFRFITRFFGNKVVKKGAEPFSDQIQAGEHLGKPEPEIRKQVEEASIPGLEHSLDSKTEGWRGQLILSSTDLMQMARKLQNKGELYRAEQLLRDGVKNALQNQEYWWLLFEIEEPLNRKGRALYCIEQVLQLNVNHEMAIEKAGELKELIDADLSYFIEYKLAPEFYRLI